MGTVQWMLGQLEKWLTSTGAWQTSTECEMYVAGIAGWHKERMSKEAALKWKWVVVMENENGVYVVIVVLNEGWF
jgi:hypothetical protein